MPALFLYVGVRTVRLSDEVSVVAALETPSATQKVSSSR